MADKYASAKYYRAVTWPMSVNGRDSTLYEVELLCEEGKHLAMIACLGEAQQKQVTEVLRAMTIVCELMPRVEPVVVFERVADRIVFNGNGGEK
jgi:hypothetical protein